MASSFVAKVGDTSVSSRSPWLQAHTRAARPAKAQRQWQVASDSGSWIGDVTTESSQRLLLNTLLISLFKLEIISHGILDLIRFIVSHLKFPFRAAQKKESRC
jgi:hypothetical protein